ncbi:RNA polymerase sigma factor [Prosthecobacter sp.]|uniref:RNA polymerase sigma factor n=1 Tax=Prosthecobacter sp. TaxID=1965333 RepID=UPI00378323AB
MPPENPHRFPDTRITLLKRSLNAADPKSLDALDELCRLYEPPVLAWLRTHVADPHAVEDLRQSFFVKILHQEAFAAALEPGVSLRAVLLGRLRYHYLDYLRSIHRGRRDQTDSLDSMETGDREKIEPSHTQTADKEFHNQWRLTMLKAAVQAEREKRLSKGMSAQDFAEILDCVFKQNTALQKDVAARIGMDAEEMKQAVFRLREAIGKTLRSLVADTLVEPTESEIDAEIDCLETPY